MQTFNRVQIMGHVGRLPTLATTRNGRPFCRIQVATDGFGKDAQGLKRATWHSVHVFGLQATRTVEGLAKGAPVYIEGRLETSESERDGVKVWQTWITADKVNLLASANAKNDTAALEPSAEEARDFEDGDIVV